MTFEKNNSVFKSLYDKNKEILSQLNKENGFWQYFAGDFTSAFPILLRKSKEGDISASELIGVMYFYGLGVAPDPGKAHRVLSALNALSPMPAVVLGLCYVSGNGCLKSYELAKKNIRPNLCLCEGQFILMIARDLSEHRSQLLSKEQIYAFYCLAAHLGDSEAHTERDKLEISLTDDEISSAQTLSADMLKRRSSIAR